MFSFQKPRPEAEKRYSLLIVFNDESELYKYYSHSPLVIAEWGKRYEKNV